MEPSSAGSTTFRESPPGPSKGDANDSRAPKGNDFPTSPFIPQEAFFNVYGDMVDAEQALEVTA